MSSLFPSVTSMVKWVMRFSVRIPITLFMSMSELPEKCEWVSPLGYVKSQLCGVSFCIQMDAYHITLLANSVQPCIEIKFI